MARVFGRKTFAGKDVSEVAAAVGADDLGALPVRVGDTPYRPWDLVVEAGPAAERMEFVRRAIQRRIASFAGVAAGGVMQVVRPGEGPFRALVYDDAFFFGG